MYGRKSIQTLGTNSDLIYKIFGQKFFTMFYTQMCALYNFIGISNIAYNKTSSQSSTEDPGKLFSMANDGNRIVHGNLCIITLKQWKPWWRVDLDREAAVKGIIVIFEDIYDGVVHSVSVGNDYSNGGMNNRLCVENVTIEDRQLHMLVCQTTLYGQYVTVFTYRQARLKVCEVEVYEGKYCYLNFKRLM